MTEAFQFLTSTIQSYYYGICSFAKVLFGIKMAVDILKNLNASDIQSTIKTLINGSVSYAGLYFAMDILNDIEKAFKH